jgi:hypothetical protein
MNRTITIRPAQTITVEEVKIIAVRDLFEEKKIIARIKDLPVGVILWEGDEEYASASNWTNESAQARVEELLSSDSLKFV